MKKILLTIITLFAIVGVSAPVLAYESASQKEFDACVNKSNGDLRVLAECMKKEYASVQIQTRGMIQALMADQTLPDELKTIVANIKMVDASQVQFEKALCGFSYKALEGGELSVLNSAACALDIARVKAAIVRNVFDHYNF